MITGNNVDCGLSRRGVGIAECEQKLGKPVGFWDLGSNFSLDVVNGSIDREAVLELIRRGELHTFNNALDFTENNEDDVTETFTSGIIADVRDGLPAFDFTYIDGYSSHALRYTHNSFGGAIALLFDNGVIGFAESVDGNRIEGLTRGRLKVATFKNNTGSEVAKTMISLQLTDTLQYNTRMFLINTNSFGSNPLNINSAINLDIVPTVAPSVGDTETIVSVTASANSAIRMFPGLLPTDFQISGQNVTGAAYDSVTGQYTIAHNALVVGSKTISLGDGTATAVRVGTTEMIYSGASRVFTV